MALVSYFVASLRCRVCGQASRAAIETTLVDIDYARELIVGAPTDLRVSTVHTVYHKLREPDDEPLRLLETWACSHCPALNWALVALRDGVVEAIEDVTLAHGLHRAHFLTRDLDEPFERLTRKPFRVDGLPCPGWLEALRSVAARRT